MWSINKGQLDTSFIQFTKITSIVLCNNNRQSITLDFLNFIGRVFQSRNQTLECKYWTFPTPHILYEQ
ncbi:unnamed protein product, partial [Rotaria sp. Silwood1]